MAVERPFEAWEEMQRHGLDLADRLTQGFSDLFQSHMNPSSFPWTNHQKFFDHDTPSQIYGKMDFGLSVENSAKNGVSAILDIGNMLGQAGADFGACVNGVVEQFFRRLPSPFRQDENDFAFLRVDYESKKGDDGLLGRREDYGLVERQLRTRGHAESNAGSDDFLEEGFGMDLKSSPFGRSQGSISITSTYDSRTNGIESSLVARGDLWRVEASNGGSTSGNESSPLSLIQLGPLLFVRDSTFLFPVHLSKQNLLWYGYNRKNGMHSLCPALWSKHRRWLLMSMVCLNPLACSFMDLQFPNGQFTYVSGEGLTTSAFVPAFGGLLQAQGQYPGEMRFSFSYKSKSGTHITPMLHWPDKSFSLGLVQDLAWQRSGLMVRPTFQLSICPSFGEINRGLQAEIIHSVKEKVNLVCGCVSSAHPCAYFSVALGRSKWNGNFGNSGVVIRVEAPLSGIRGPSFSIQLNSGIEF